MGIYIEQFQEMIVVRKSLKQKTSIIHN